MGYIEQCIVDWISEDGDRLNEFVTLLGHRAEDDDTFATAREKLAQSAPACGIFWQQLLLAAIADADWRIIATELTDRREPGTGGDAWIMVDRREP